MLKSIPAMLDQKLRDLRFLPAILLVSWRGMETESLGVTRWRIAALS